MTIQQKLAEIEKGCGKKIKINYVEAKCGISRQYKDGGEFISKLCPTCQAKKEGIIECARILLDDEIEFLEYINNKLDQDTIMQIEEKINILKKQKEDLR